MRLNPTALKHVYLEARRLGGFNMIKLARLDSWIMIWGSKSGVSRESFKGVIITSNVRETRVGSYRD